MSVKYPAVFLDRDGTINVEKDYLYKIVDFEFIPGAPEAIKRLKDAGYLVIVVTNQSGVARGYYSLDDVEKLHLHIQAELQNNGTSIDAFYLCPHHPTEGAGVYSIECSCRKPEPGMLLQAADEWGIDLNQSYIIGDKMADVVAGQAAGCVPIMVKTGYGHHESRKTADSDILAFNDIVEAVDFILRKSEHQIGSKG